MPTPTDEEVVQAASDAAEGVVLSRYKQSQLRDFDVSVTFEDGVLDVDVYVNAPDDAEDAEQVAENAALAAQAAVDDLFAEAEADADSDVPDEESGREE